MVSLLVWPNAVGNKMASRSSVEKITCVCGEVVLSCRNQNHLKVVSKMLVLARRLREAQGMDNNTHFNVCLLLLFCFVVFFAEGAWVCQTTGNYGSLQPIFIIAVHDPGYYFRIKIFGF